MEDIRFKTIDEFTQEGEYSFEEFTKDVSFLFRDSHLRYRDYTNRILYRYNSTLKSYYNNRELHTKESLIYFCCESIYRKYKKNKMKYI